MFQGVDPLILMVTTLKGCGAVLVWAFTILLLFLTLFAFLVNQMLVTYYMTNKDIDIVKRKEVFEYFGTFSRSLFSMFEMTLGNWVPIARILGENVSQWFLIFSVLHKLTMGFAVIGVINGIFIQETFKVAQGDDVIMLMQKERAIGVHTRKMKQLFSAADSSGDGMLSWEEFKAVLEKPSVRNWMAAQEMDATDANKLFQLLVSGKPDGGLLSAEELVQGMSSIKGAARSLDLIHLMGVISREIGKLSSQINNVVLAVDHRSRMPTSMPDAGPIEAAKVAAIAASDVRLSAATFISIR